MELRQLKNFARVAIGLNFPKASRKLFVPQSTLCQLIKQLEDELGTRLLSHNTNNVTLAECSECPNMHRSTKVP